MHALRIIWKRTRRTQTELLLNNKSPPCGVASLTRHVFEQVDEHRMLLPQVSFVLLLRLSQPAAFPAYQPCMTEIYIQFLCAHYGFYQNAPVSLPRHLSQPMQAPRRLYLRYIPTVALGTINPAAGAWQLAHSR